jgi:O-antigen/teichoic acid export membrane protein
MSTLNQVIRQQLGSKIARNTVSNAAGRIWLMTTQFLLTPYLLGKLGDERFGIWAFLAVFVGYFAVFDLGLGMALIKYVSEYSTSGDSQKLNRIINCGLIIITLLMGALGVVGFYLSADILRLFRVSLENYAEARFALIGFFILMIGQGPLSVFQSVLNGLQRMDLLNLVGIVASVANVLGVLFFLGFGYGLRGLIYNNAIILVLNMILTVLCVFRSYPKYRLLPIAFDWGSARQLLNFGLQMQANNLAALICWHGDKILIGYFLNMVKVTAYELGYRLATAAKTFPSFFFSAIMPAAAEVHARQDRVQLQRLFDLGSRYLALLTFPSMLFLIFNAPLIMAAWMRESRPDSVWAARLLAVGFLVNVLGGVGSSVARGMGRPDLETRTILPYLLINFGIGIPLIMKVGFWGPLIATPLSTVFATAYLFYQFPGRLGISVKSFLQEGIWSPALGCLVAVLVTAVFGISFSWSPQSSRLVLIAHSILQATVFFGSFTLFIWKFSNATAGVSEWDLIREGFTLATFHIYTMLAKILLVKRVITVPGDRRFKRQ